MLEAAEACEAPSPVAAPPRGCPGFGFPLGTGLDEWVGVGVGVRVGVAEGVGVGFPEQLHTEIQPV